MIKNELKSLLQNKLLLLVVFAIMLIPAIYAGLFLASMWDPYGDLEYLPVAVVNKDEPVTYNDTELKVGENLVDSLKKNDSLSFNFVDEETADSGLKNGTYYMVVTIPKNFSKNASSLMDDKPQQMVLDYKTNPGKNYIAMKLSESAVKEITKNITKEITRTYAENVFDSVQTIGDGFDDAVDGTEEMLDGEKKLVNGNKKITKNLNKLADSTLTFKDGSETLTEGLETYTDGVTQIDDGLNTLNDGVSSLSEEAVGGAKTLAKGAKKINTSLKDYTNGVASAKAGSKKLRANNSALIGGINTVSSGVGTLKTGSSQLLKGLKTMKGSLDTALTEDNTQSINLAANSLPTLNDNIKKLNTAVNGDGEENTGLDLSGLTTSLTSVGGNVQSAGTDLVAAGASTASAGENVKAIAGNVSGAGNDLTNASGKITTAYTALAALKQSGSLTPAQAAYVDSAMAALYDPSGASSENVAGYVLMAGSKLTSTTEQFTAAQNNLENVGTKLGSAGGSLTSAGTVLTTLSNSNLTEQVGVLKTSISQLAEGSEKLLPPSSTALKTLLGGMQSVQTALNQTQEKDGTTGLIEGMTALDTGIGTLKTGIDGKSGLKAGIKTYTGGVTTLDKGLSTLKGYNKDINSGTSALAKGSRTLATGLDGGVVKLTDGAEKLLNGSSKLVENNDTLLDGANQLSDGAGQIADGAGKLHDGSSELGEGIDSLKDGTKKLNDALGDGSKEIRDSNASENTLDMFSEPVTSKETQITKVEDNGHAMAAYMMSVGLWVGCLAFCLMYPLASYKGKFKGGLAWWASKAVVIYPLAVLMSWILIGALHIINGFNPVEFGKTLLVAGVTSVAFMSIMYFFNIAVGKVGSFIMLVFMVLQLAGSAGTYPVELSGPLVSALHKFVPFTYSVDAFRSVISGGEPITTQLTFLISLAIVFTILTIAVFCIRGEKMRRNKPTIYEWIEDEGLA